VVKTLAANVPTALCLLVVMAAVVSAVVMRLRRRGTDTGGWAPAQGVVLTREEVRQHGELWLRLVVEFRSWRGQMVRFTDEAPAWQVPYPDDTVAMIFDPASPEKGRLVRRNRH